MVIMASLVHYYHQQSQIIEDTVKPSCLSGILYLIIAWNQRMVISTKFEVDLTIHNQDMTFSRLIRYVTLWPWPLAFWHWKLIVYIASRDQPLYQFLAPYEYPFLSYDCLNLTAKGNTSCANAHALCHVTYLQGLINHTSHFWNLWPRFAYSLCNFYGTTIKIKSCYSPKYCTALY